MKSLSTFFVAIATIFVSMTLVSCRDTIVPSDKLPKAAQSFIKEYFPENAVSFVKKDAELMKTTYEVILQDGTEIDFNGKGECEKVDCKKSEVPASLVPVTIAEYVQTNFPGQIVVKIDKERHGYEIELGNGLDLRFNKNGKLREIDD